MINRKLFLVSMMIVFFIIFEYINTNNEKQISIYTPNDTIGAFNAFGSTTLLSNGDIINIYSSESEDGGVNFGMFQSRSINNGTSWDKPIRFTSSNNSRLPSFISDYNNNRTYIFYSNMDMNGSPLLMRYTDDNAFSWSEQIELINSPAYSVQGGITLRNGRKILAIMGGDNLSIPGYVGSIYCDISCDRADNWHRSKYDVLGGEDEPSIVELGNGTLLMYLRPWNNHIVNGYMQIGQSMSYDIGDTWTNISWKMEFNVSSSPPFLYRYSWDPNIILLAYNDAHARNNLLLSYSTDDGNTWSKPKLISHYPQVSYPAIIKASNGDIIISYYKSNSYTEAKKADIFISRIKIDDIVKK